MGSVRADRVCWNVRWFEPGNRRGRLHHHLRRRLGDGYVADMAELAVQIFGRGAMHVTDRMGGETGHCEQQHEC